MDDAELVEMAIEARKGAYCPYSRFAVGAALLGSSGEVYLAANIENSVNGLSLCAERVALFTAMSSGEKSFMKIAVVCESPYCRPCGACRQVLFEHAPDIDVLMGNPKGEFVTRSLRDLLPEPFSL